MDLWKRLASGGLVFTSIFAQCVTTPSLAAEMAVPAHEFVDSVGVNIHLSYMDTLYYTDFPLISSSLHALGVRHVRDGYPSDAAGEYYKRQRILAKSGIRADFIVGRTAGEFPTAHDLCGLADHIEAPNEFDRTGDFWRQRLLSILQQLSSMMRTSEKDCTLPIIGPSLTAVKSYHEVGDLTAYSDIGNLHNYFGGHNPGTGGWGNDGYGSISWNLRNAALTNPDQPVITTETGYTNQASVAGSVPEGIAARYMPRLLLEQWLHGIHHTYLYELLSSGGEDFGLLRTDGSPKATFHSVVSLLQLLNDPGNERSSAALDYTITGAPPDLHHLLFVKRDGTFYLALWIEASGYDVNSHTETPVLPRRIEVRFMTPARDVSTITFNDAGFTTTQTEVVRGQALAQVVTDRLVVLRISPLTR